MKIKLIVINLKMGIKNLTKFLREKYPCVFTQIPISHFQHHKVGIESHLFLYKFKCATFSYNGVVKNSNDWKTQLMYFLVELRKNGTHPVIIFEGKKPLAKSKTIQNRIDQREKVKVRMQLLIQSKRMLSTHSSLSQDILNNLRDLGQDIEKINDHKFIDSELEKLGKRTIYISNEDIETFKIICVGLGIPFANAKCEAEAYLSRLLDAKKLDAVMTEDSDTLAYGVSNLIMKYKSGMSEFGFNICHKTSTQTVIDKLELTQEQFLDFCVLCGNDYVENPKNLGCVKLHKLVKENKYNHLWNDEYEEAKQIFLNQGVKPSEEYENFDWCDIPTINTIKNMLKRIGCKDSPEKIQKLLCANINFEFLN